MHIFCGFEVLIMKPKFSNQSKPEHFRIQPYFFGTIHQLSFIKLNHFFYELNLMSKPYKLSYTHFQ